MVSSKGKTGWASSTKVGRHITCSAVALQCCKAHSKINRKIENLIPCKIVTPENFILKLGTNDYVENITYKQIFMYIASVGASPQIGDPLVTFSCPVVSIFFQRPSRIARPIFAVYGSNDMVQPKDGPFWVRVMRDIIWGKCASKTPKTGVNRHFQAKLA